MTNLQSDLDFSVSDICSKEMSKIIVTLFAATGCDVTSSFFVLTKELFGNELKKTEARMSLTQLLHENLNKFVLKYIYNNKVSTTLT